MKILTSNDDDFLYSKLLDLLKEIKLVQGGTALSSSLRRHNQIKLYLIEKQIQRIKEIETTYFTDSGLNRKAIDSFYSLQNSKNVLN